MIDEAEIRKKLAEVLVGELPLYDFEDWLEDESINMLRNSSASAIDLVGSIQLMLAEHDDGVRDESDLRQRFRELLNDVEGSVVLDASGVHVGRGPWVFTSINPLWRLRSVSV